MSSFIIVCFGWQEPEAEPAAVLDLAAQLTARFDSFEARLVGWSAKWRSFRVELSTGDEPIVSTILAALSDGLAHCAGVSDRAVETRDEQCWGPGLFAAEQLAACARPKELLVEQSAVQLIGLPGSEPEITSVQIGAEVVDAIQYLAGDKSSPSAASQPSVDAPAATGAFEPVPESLASTDYVELAAESVDPETLRQLAGIDSDPHLGAPAPMSSGGLGAPQVNFVENDADGPGDDPYDSEHYRGPSDRPTISEFPPKPSTPPPAATDDPAGEAASDDAADAQRVTTSEASEAARTASPIESLPSEAVALAAPVAEPLRVGASADEPRPADRRSRRPSAPPQIADVEDLPPAVGADGAQVRRLSEPPPKPASWVNRASSPDLDGPNPPNGAQAPLVVPQRLSEPPPKPSRRPSNPGALPDEDSSEATPTRVSQPPPVPPVAGERRLSNPPPKPSLSEVPRRLSNPPPKPSRAPSRAAFDEAATNLDDPSPPSGVDLVAVLGAPPTGAEDEGGGISVDEKTPPQVQDAARDDEERASVVDAVAIERQVEAAMAALARGEVQGGLLGLAEAARCARKLGPQRACGARLSLAAGLVKAGRPREALAEALDAYAYAKQAQDESQLRACGKLLQQLAESHGSEAAAEPWRRVVARADGAE